MRPPPYAFFSLAGLGAGAALPSGETLTLIIAGCDVLGCLAVLMPSC